MRKEQDNQEDETRKRQLIYMAVLGLYQALKVRDQNVNLDREIAMKQEEGYIEFPEEYLPDYGELRPEDDPEDFTTYMEPYRNDHLEEL